MNAYYGCIMHAAKAFLQTLIVLQANSHTEKLQQ